MAAIFEYLEIIKSIEENVLQYLDEDDLDDFHFSNLITSFQKLNIKENKFELKLILNLISRLSIYHHRSERFFSKIEKILKELKDLILLFFSNLEIITIFKKSKRMLLFLLEEKIISFDENFKKITKSKKKEFFYNEYFLPCIDQFSDDELNVFKINQKVGENEQYICELIRKDSIEEFVSFLTRKNISYSMRIAPSIFETNVLLFNKKILPDETITLIEYAAFFGSFQIFQYLLFNDVELTSSLWDYAIHGNNPNIIHILEENGMKPIPQHYYYKNAIECHHNQIADYLMLNYMADKETAYLHYMIKAYNFISISDTISKILEYNSIDFEKMDVICNNLINSLGKYGYIHLIDLLIQDSKFAKYKNISLYIAIEHNYFEFTQHLLSKYCINVNSQIEKNNVIETPLIIAVKNNDVEITKLLLSYPDIDVNFIPVKMIENEYYLDGEPALHIAIKNGNLEITKLLLSHKNIDVNCSSKFTYYEMEGQTALHLAVIQSEVEICRLLLSRTGINVNSLLIKNQNNGKYQSKYEKKAPIHIAAEKGNLEIMSLLLSHDDIDINAKSYLNLSCIDKRILHEKTALHIAIENQDIDIISLLLSNAATDVNVSLISELQENNFFIDRICRQDLEENPDMASILPRDIHEKSESKTPLFIAKELNNNIIIKLLLDRKDLIFNSNNAIYEEATYYCYKERKGFRYQQNKKNLSNLDILS